MSKKPEGFKGFHTTPSGSILLEWEDASGGIYYVSGVEITLRMSAVREKNDTDSWEQYNNVYQALRDKRNAARKLG